MDEELQQERNVFFKRSRKGKVLKLIREKYLRGDIECGYRLGTVVSKTVMKEVQHLNLSIFRRLCALINDETKLFIFFPNETISATKCLRMSTETANDWNDRAIRISAKYYSELVTHDTKLLLLTNDQDNQKYAKMDDLESMTMNKYIFKYYNQCPDLLDMLSRHSSSIDNITQSTGSSITPNVYDTHVTMDDALAGIKNRRYYSGTLRCRDTSNSHGDNWGNCYVIIHHKRKNSMNSGTQQEVQRRSVLIEGKQNVNRALDGDVVCVEILDDESLDHDKRDESYNYEETAVADFVGESTIESIEGLADQKRRKSISGKEKSQQGVYGRVVGIIRRNWRQYAGSIIPLESDSTAAASVDLLQNSGQNDEENLVSQALFVPVSPKIPKVLVISRQLNELQGKRVLVSIDCWPANSHYPVGHYIRTLGDDTDKDVETEVLLHEHGVPHESFTAEVMACLPPQNWRITEDLVAKRTDLRHIPVVSIDPPGCKDIDDALHCRLLSNGNFEVGVHIADVTHFIEEETPLDKEAAHRSTSTYLVDRRLDMLPGYLTTELCSLRSSEDHLAFSVLWEMNNNANIIDVKFCKSVIRSVASMTYDEAQAMLDSDDSSDDNSLHHTIMKSVKNLNHIAKQLRANRINEGALTLASPEVRFKFDGETDNPTDVSMYNIKESNQLVEEFMLLANITVSKKILRHYPTLCVLRRHQSPSQEQFAGLLSAARAVNVILDISSSKTLADSLDNAVRPDDPYFNKLLRMLSTKCMMPAQYFCSGELSKDQWHHYGLAAPVYTHFTSPIRRYADIIVHRLLAAAIGVKSLHPVNSDRTKAQELCSHMNRRHKSAQHIQRASTNMHTILFFRNKPSTETGYVMSVSTEKIVVFIPRFGIEGSISFKNILESNFQDEINAVSKTQHLETERLLERELDNWIEVNEDLHRATLFLPFLPGNEEQVNLSWQVFQKVNVSIHVDEGVGTGARKLILSLVLSSPKRKSQSTTSSKDLPEVHTKSKKKKAKH